jgi:hypothetical protein
VENKLTWEEAQAAWNDHKEYVSAEKSLTAGNEHYSRSFHKDLVSLTGTEKQIEYAERLREDMIRYCLTTDKSDQDGAVMSTLWDWVMSQTEAAFWVENFKRSKDTGDGYSSSLVTAASPKMRAQLRENVKRYRSRSS